MTPSDTIFDLSDGIEILGSSVCSPCFTREFWNMKMREAAWTIGKVTRFQEALTELSPVRSCLGVCRINHFLHTVPTDQSRNAARQFIVLI